MKKYRKIIILPILCAVILGGCKQSETSVIPDSNNNNAIYACTIDSDSIFTDGRASQLCSDGNDSFYAVRNSEHGQNYLVKIYNNETEVICDLSKGYDAVEICSINVTDSSGVAVLFYDNDINYCFLLFDPKLKNFEKYYIENSEINGTYNVRCEYFQGKFFIYNDFHIYVYTLDNISEFCGQIKTEWGIDKLICGRTTCKKERLYKANDDYKKRAMADPIREVYLNFDNKCRSYRKKLSDSPELLEKYNAAFDGFREKIRAVKKGLTSRSSADDVDRYNQMCFDACQDLQDLAKEFKKQNENT